MATKSRIIWCLCEWESAAEFVCSRGGRVFILCAYLANIKISEHYYTSLDGIEYRTLDFNIMLVDAPLSVSLTIKIT
jgi:hypothetical protein